jgi:solute carrier family 25 ornithine transporter 2/15
MAQLEVEHDMSHDSPQLYGSGSRSGSGGSLGDFISGGLGGLACVGGGQPFDTVKVKLQTFPHLYTSTFDCIKKTYIHDGGMRGFYAGASPAFITNLIENAVLFLVYEHCLSFIKSWTNTRSKDDISWLHHAAAGSIASVAASLSYAPIDRVKSLIQVERELKGDVSQKRNQVVMLHGIIQREGVLGLYRGLTALLARETPGYFFFFAGYSGTKKLLKSEDETMDDLALWKVVTSGIIAGCCFWGSMYPCDVIKARIQVRQDLSKSFVKNVMIIMKQELQTKGGVRSLYRGLSPTLIRSFFANGALFITYEWTKRFYHQRTST